MASYELGTKKISNLHDYSRNLSNFSFRVLLPRVRTSQLNCNPSIWYAMRTVGVSNSIGYQMFSYLGTEMYTVWLSSYFSVPRSDMLEYN